MTTALEIITDALFEIGAAETGQSVPAEDSALALRKLNQIVQRWSNSPLAFPVLQEFSITLDGSASYTVGPGGTPVTLRPIKIVAATAIDSGGLETSVRVLGQTEWDAITLKDVDGGPPDSIWYQASVTDGVVYVYPKSTGYTLKLDAQGLLNSALVLATTLTFPEGYESALMLTLADDLGASFGKPTPPDIRRRAAAAMALIKRTNAQTLLAQVGLTGGADYHIERGY